jgi:putative tryptophan/tyrosine transport system substrate-binding protein
MRRREFITLLAGAAGWPLAVNAQQPTKPTIGWLDIRRAVPRDNFEAFRRGLAEIGFLEGRDVTIEYRLADGHPERLSGLAADLVHRRVAAIVAPQGNSALVAKAETRDIPIIFSMGNDPVELGLVASLNRPGGNLTGVVVLASDVAAKRLELLHKLMPATESIAMLGGRADSPFIQEEARNAQSAASTLGLRLQVFNATTDSEVAAAFATLAERQVGAVLMTAGTQLDARKAQIISLAARYALPTIFFNGDAVREGGLLSYGPLVNESYRQAGVYTGRVLKGEKPADLPVQLSTRFELVINLKTARALGLEIPPLLRALADEVIE